MNIYSFIVVVSLLLVACGGGSSSSEQQLIIDSNSVSFFGEIGEPTPQTESVSGRINGITETVYIFIDASNSEIIESAEVYFGGAGEYSAELEITPRSPDNFSEGTHSEQITIQGCFDSACTRQVSGSPKQLQVIYVVEDNRLQLSVAELEGGTIVESKLRYQCSDGCEFNVSDPGETLSFVAVPRPGYEFVSWNGSCGSSEICEIDYFDNGEIQIGATFEESSNRFNACSEADLSMYTESGNDRFEISNTDEAYFRDFISLCGGLVIGADVHTNQVFVRDIVLQTTIKSYPISEQISSIAIDKENNLLFVSLADSTKLIRIDLATDSISAISIYDDIEAITTNDSGQIFVSSRNQYGGPIVVLDTSTLKLLDNLSIVQGGAEHMVFDGSDSRLFVANGLNVRAYSYPERSDEPISGNLIIGDGARRNCRNIMISDDGEHIAFPCGGGNGPNYSIYDYSTSGYDVVLGEWNTGAFPNGGDFASSSVLFTDGDELQLYNINDHQLIFSFEPEVTSCYGSIRRALISTDASLLIGLNDCGHSSVISWYQYDTSN